MIDPALLQASNETLNNASAGVNSGFADASGLVPVVLVAAWTVIVVGFVSAARSNEYFHKLIDALGFVADSFVYFSHGVVALAGLGLIMSPAYLVATADPGTRQTVGKYVLAAVGIYAVVTAVGYYAKERVIDPIRSNVSGVMPEPDETDGNAGVGD